MDYKITKRWLLGIGMIGMLAPHGYTHGHISTMQETEGHAAHHDRMHGMYGRYPMTREASGTSWVPDSSPLDGFHVQHGDWVLMPGGFVYLVFDEQRGLFGAKQVFQSSMAMIMAHKDLSERATLGLRGMFSAEPLGIDACGYPLLFQTGETCDGVTPLINHQHPHDLFMELALVGTFHVSPASSAFVYCALPGEPALGPPIFLMRFASQYIPEAPISHHWIDSTHISFGVITGGLVFGRLKIEVSGFNGREPDQHRFGFDAPKINSYAGRLSCNPTENLALQASCGFLKGPEQLEPCTTILRSTLSLIYNKAWNDRSNAQIAAIIGINQAEPGRTLPAFLCDATVECAQRHLFFGRVESVKKDDLFLVPDPLAGQAIWINKLTLGYIFEPLTRAHIKWGLGGLVDFHFLPNATAKARYGSTTSYMIFAQMSLV